ncbi:MAG: hypothetical protein IJY39_03310 [Clostridia bacterium]|nr:hypothetical protein [Clostridia bacterium]
MNSVKLRLLAILLCLATVLTLAACNGDETDTDAQANESSEAVTDENSESGSEQAEGTTDVGSEEETEVPDVTVEVSGDSAAVTNTAGLSYSVTGFESVKDDAFAFTKGLTITFDEETFADKFNRFTLSYSATAPMHIYVTYRMGIGTEHVDDYYLEAGEGSFSGLIVDYLEKKKGNFLTQIVIDTCKDEEASFSLYHIETEMAEVYTGTYGSKTFYIDNGRFKLGVDMGWGGTINYIEDLSQNIEGLTNLVNKHDTGRLIQQSYYGTGAIEGVFEWGSFNGSDKWPYNPVQGGGQSNVASRLIDVVVDDNCVYIKAQPMDWGKSDIKYITPSYMENWYILEEDYIRIDNRFVDFSGWEHPYRGQELPAFYTVSYLDTFIWYGGTKPWTGDEVSSRDDLMFWGDDKYAGDCIFPIRENNTETWCAWVNTDIDFGFGLYVPKVDRLKAGRYQYNGSKDADDNATNYVAPYNTIKLVSYEALEYSYLITTGTAEEIRATFTENKDFATNDSLHKNYTSSRLPDLTLDMSNIDFTVEGNYKVFTAPNCATASYDTAEKATKLTVDGTDPYLYLNFVLSDKECFAEDYDKVEIVYMIPTTNANSSSSCQLFTCTGEQTSATGSMAISGSLIKDGQYHTLTINVGSYAFWQGKINQLRFDFFNTAAVGDVMYVKSVKLVEGNGNAASVTIEGTRVDFSKEENLIVLGSPRNTTVTYDADQKAAKLKVDDANDVNVTVSFKVFPGTVTAEDYPTLKLEYMIPATNGQTSYEADIFLCAGDVVSPNGNARIRVKLIADGEYHTLEVDLSSNSYWKGIVNMIRLDYFDKCVAGDVFYVKSMELAK